jgi:cysteine synthase
MGGHNRPCAGGRMSAAGVARGHALDARHGAANSLLDLLGNTPVVRLSGLAAKAGLNAELFLKLEYQNPGGSHKARIAVNMIRRAEARGDLVPGSGQTIVEPTGGNTGMGLAIAARLMGYKLVLVIPSNYSVAKRRILALYGARIFLADVGSGPNPHGKLAQALQLANSDWVLLNQSANPANPAAHDLATGPEILATFVDDPPDYFIGGVGTGGHLSALGRMLKTRWPGIKIVAVQPKGCDLRTGTFAPHSIQGFAVGLVPANFDPSVVDCYCQITDKEAVQALRMLIDTDAIGVGISTGANLAATVQIARRNPGKRFLSLAYDRVDAYLDEIDAIDSLSCSEQGEASCIDK